MPSSNNEFWRDADEAERNHWVWQSRTLEFLLWMVFGALSMGMFVLIIRSFV